MFASGANMVIYTKFGLLLNEQICMYNLTFAICENMVNFTKFADIKLGNITSTIFVYCIHAVS